MRTDRRIAIGIVAAVAMLVAVLPLVLGGNAAGSAGRFTRHDVDVFFTRQAALEDGDCDRTRAYGRNTIGQDVLHDAMNALLKGPSAAEEKDGATSLFSHRTAGMINSVRVSDGTAFVDFDDLRRIIPGASSSCGSASLLAELNRTAKQFPTVDRTIYSFEGSVNAFYGWLQMDVPEV
jgi:spore germination protein GerM